VVSLTGSRHRQAWIAKAAADTLKRVHLELGGKAPVVVFDDVDLESAMGTIAGTGYYNAGEDWSAAARVLASKDVYDEVVTGLATHAGSSDGRHHGRRHDALDRVTPAGDQATRSSIRALCQLHGSSHALAPGR